MAWGNVMVKRRLALCGKQMLRYTYDSFCIGAFVSRYLKVHLDRLVAIVLRNFALLKIAVQLNMGQTLEQLDTDGQRRAIHYY